MTTRVYVPTENEYGIIVTLMAYGAIVRYYSGGIEFNEMLDAEDYEILEENDDE